MSLDADVRATFTAPGAEPFTVDASLSVPDGETLVVLGPSGSGKSLLLECVAGFHDHEGRVVLHGRDVTDAPPERRDFGFVFQDYALFPHMTARENVNFGARYYENPRDADDLLELLGVAHLTERSPRTLSGGEQQRVALARALAVRPDALLLDEPLSALDTPTRQTLREDLADVLADVTAVYVTHDRTTARALGDRVAVVRDGRLVQTGPPETVFETPSSPFVARFTGSNCLRLADLPVDRSALPDAAARADATHLAVRPEHVSLADAAVSDGSGTPRARPASNRILRGVVRRVLREDAAHRVTVALDGRMTDDREKRTPSTDSPTLDVLTSDPPATGATVDVDVPSERAAYVQADES